MGETGRVGGITTVETHVPGFSSAALVLANGPAYNRGAGTVSCPYPLGMRHRCRRFGSEDRVERTRPCPRIGFPKNPLTENSDEGILDLG